MSPTMQRDMPENNIVMIDDNDVDVELVRRGALRRGDRYGFFSLPNAHAALEHLSTATLPQRTVLLLDLHMPGMSGLDLLAEIHRDSALCLAPVFVLTTSALDADVAEAYRLRAAGYITKRDAGPGYERVFDLLDEYVYVVRLPDSVAAH